MKVSTLVLGILAAPVPIVPAQDIQPVFDLPDMARGQVIGSTAKGYADRDGARSARENQRSRARATCANKERAAAKMGRNHPKVRQLYSLCKQAGY